MNMKGFTLIESMIAVTILTLAIAGPLFTANSAIVAARAARDELTASYLAQEGIEYVRALRDQEFLAIYPNVSAAWTNFITNIEGQCRATSCTLDPVKRSMGYGSGAALVACSGQCAVLTLLADGVYTERSDLGGTQTIFTRALQVERLTDTDERIVSTVSWSYHGTPHTVRVYDHLTPWQ